MKISLKTKKFYIEYFLETIKNKLLRENLERILRKSFFWSLKRVFLLNSESFEDEEAHNS